MKLGKVVGTVVSSRKDEKLEGLRLYMVQDLSLKMAGRESFVVAAPTHGPRLGDIVD